jgi:anti-sigma B factor antagonist
MSIADGNDDIVVVEVGTQLVTATRGAVRDAVLAALERGGRRIRLDFSRTADVDSSGLGMLVSLAKKVRERGGEVRITSLNDDLAHLFRLTRLDMLFHLEDGDEGSANAGVRAPVRPSPGRRGEIA